MTSSTMTRPAMVTPQIIAGQWMRLADWHVQTLDTRVLAAAAALAPALYPFEFGALCEALEWLEDVTQPGFDLNSVAPDERDIDLLDRDAHARVDDALQTLIGGCL